MRMSHCQRRGVRSWVAAGWLAGTLAGGWAQGMAFVPNDPYFSPNLPGAVTRPGYYGQWHLLNQMPVTEVNAGLDANVWGAWQRGLTGQGVVISILDDGTQGNHPELLSKFRNEFSWDYAMSLGANNAQAFRGMPQIPEDNHGTSVAGVAAALGGNGIGVTGAAPYAQIAAQRLLIKEAAGGISDNLVEVRAIGFQGQKNADGLFDPSVPFTGEVAPVRVMNHSYGPSSGYVLEQDWQLLHPALAESAARNVIHVYSAGNQRDTWTTQDSNTILVNTSPDVIVVAALGSDGAYAYYSSFGANVLVTAPSSSYAGYFSIATTDRTARDGYNDWKDGPDPYFSPVGRGNLADYVSQFGGTSSAAPLVAGIMALGIEANPAMNLRLARQLLTRTSLPVDTADSGWIRNGAGLAFNQSYGFGLIDADAFTLRAAGVIRTTPLTVHQEPLQPLAGQSFAPDRRTLTQVYSASHPDPLPLEYVQVRITLSGLEPELTAYRRGSGAILGDISATLTSPAGTTYALFSNDRNVPDAEHRAVAAALDWTFTSYVYYGEAINGDWTLALHNASTNTRGTKFGVWDSYQFTFGTGSVFSGDDWTGMGGNEDWGDPANWSEKEVPAAGLPVYFGGDRETMVDTGSDRHTGSITFSGSAGAFVINGHTLELQGDLTSFSPAAQTINSRIILAEDSTFRTVRGDLVIDELGLGTALASRTLTVDGPGTIRIRGAISDGGTGPSRLIKTGDGTLVLTGANTYTGTTSVRQGTLATTGLPTSTVRLEGGLLSPGATGTIEQVTLQGLVLAGGGLLFDLGAGVADRIDLGSVGVGGTAATAFTFANAGFLPGSYNYTLLSGPGVSALHPGQFSFRSFIQGLQGSFSLSGDDLVFSALHNGFASGPILDNAPPVGTPTFATFVVAGAVRTAPSTGSNVINGLTFRPDGLLQVFNTLTVQGGAFQVTGGVAGMAGGLVVAPGVFRKTGPGTLATASQIQVGGNFEVQGGVLQAGGAVAVAGEGSTTGASLQVGGTMAVAGGYQAVGSVTQVDGQLQVGGPSTVSGGVLTVNGLFQPLGGLAMNDGSLLGGAGTIAGEVANNAVVNPGNSPGTITITGNYNQSAAGTLQIEAADAGNFDRLVVGGAAILAGTLQFLPLDGFQPQYGQQFAFLQAGQVLGGFATLQVPETFRGRFLTDGGTGILLLAPDSYTRVALTPNQVQAARALDSFRFATSGDAAAVSLALDLQTAAQYPAAFDAVSPAWHQNVTDLGFSLAQAQGQLLQQQFSSVRLAGRSEAAGAAPAQPLRHDKNGGALADPKNPQPEAVPGPGGRWSVWMQGNGMFGRMDTVADLPVSGFESGGFLAGADYAWSSSLATGVFAGYQGALARYGQGSDLRMNGVRFGGYATFDPEESGFYADAAVWGGSSSYTVKRPVRFSTIDRLATSRQTAHELSALLGGGYDWQAGRFTFGPAASAQFTQFAVNSFTEQGADSLDLRVGGQSAQSLQTYLGARAACALALHPDWLLVPEVRMFWQHEFLQNGRTIQAQLAGGRGAGFDFATTAPGRNAVWAGVGATVRFRDRWSGYAYYNNDFGRTDFAAGIVSGGLQMEF